MSDLDIVILAAGHGKRMRSLLPKVMHKVAGTTMIERVVATATQLNPSNIFVIYGAGGEQLQAAMQHLSVTWIKQQEQKGTGHAVAQALPQLNPNNRVIVLYGDVPLVTKEDLSPLTKMSELAVLVTHVDNPTGFGRIVRNQQGQMTSIVEHKDANAEQREINEINSGIIAAQVSDMARWLPQLSNKNVQGEFYLTDIMSLATTEKKTIHTINVPSVRVKGVNNRLELATIERLFQRQLAENYLLQGVTLLDPARFDVRGDLQVGDDVVIDINTLFEGTVRVGNHCQIGPNCLLRNTTLADHVVIEANSILDGAMVESEAVIGPFARIRPGTTVGKKARVGNFVEVKNSTIGGNSKASHLSYLGDTTIGTNVNVGAGTITCNYDGINKHKTIIEDEAFIGSGTQLIAPVTISQGAVIGAGSTITKDAPPSELTLSRAPQKTISAWKREK